MNPSGKSRPWRNDFLLTILALPVYTAAVSKYGWKIVVLLGLSVLVGALTEGVAALLQRRAIGLPGFPAWVLFPLMLPPVFPLWMGAVSLSFGLIVTVALFGGHGRQLVSPVAVSWTFATLSFSAAFGFGWSLPFPGYTMGFGRYIAARLTIVHPVDLLAARAPVSLETLLLGHFPQTPGNAVPLVTLACGLLLLLLRAVDWRSVVSFLGTTFVLMLAATSIFPGSFPPLSGLLVANVLPAGFFVFPDYRTVPRTFAGRWVTGALTGVVVVIVRGFSSDADGVLYAVLFGNVFSAIIDELILGFRKRGQEVA